MMTWDLIWDLPFKVLPSLVSLLLCWRKFNFTQVARGIEAYPDTCSDFENMKQAGYPCLKSGITALGVVLGVISLGISVIILTHFSGFPNIANGGLFGGLGMIIFGFAYIQELDSGAFTLRKSLPKSRYRFFRWFAANPSLRANFLCLLILLGFHAVILLYV